MANTIQFIDKDFVQKFWGHIKAIPESSPYGVDYTKDGADKSATETIINHLVQLYANSNALLNDVKTPTTGSYNGLTVTNTDGNVVVTLDMSNYTKNNKNTIVNALKGESGYVDVGSTYNSATGEVETITIKLTAEVINDINNLLQSVSVADKGYLSGDGKASTPITLKSDMVANATTAYKNAHTSDTEIDNLATSAYVDSQIGTYAGVTSVITTDSDLSVNKDANNKVTVSLANGNSIQSGLSTKIDAANVVATGEYVVATKSTKTDGTVSIEYSIKSSMVEGSVDDKLASKGYADDVLSKLTNVVEVDGGKDETSTNGVVEFEELGSTHKYYVTLTSNNGSVTNIELDASSFVTDKYLMSVARKSEDKTSADYDILVFTWHNANGTTSTTEISLTSLINGYSVGNGVVLGEATALDGGGTSRTISLKIDEADTYLGFDSDGGLKIKDDRVKLGTDATKKSLTTQGYVDKKFDEITKYNIGDGLVVKENYIYTPTDEFNKYTKENGWNVVDEPNPTINTILVAKEVENVRIKIDSGSPQISPFGVDDAHFSYHWVNYNQLKIGDSDIMARDNSTYVRVNKIKEIKNFSIKTYAESYTNNQLWDSRDYSNNHYLSLGVVSKFDIVYEGVICRDGVIIHSADDGDITNTVQMSYLSSEEPSYTYLRETDVVNAVSSALGDYNYFEVVFSDIIYEDGGYINTKLTFYNSIKVNNISKGPKVLNVKPKTNGGVVVDADGVSVKTKSGDYVVLESTSNSLNIDNAKVTQSVEAPNTSSTKLSTQGYVDTRLGEIENNLTTYVSGAGMTVKDGASTNEKEFELNLGSNNKYLELSGDKLQLKDGSLEKTTKTSTDTEKAYLATQGYVDDMFASNVDTHAKVVWNDAQADTNFPY